MLRSMVLYSEKYGLSGRADAVEEHEDRSLVPVEYKSGVPHGEAANIQVCAQGLCLEEMTGSPVSHGYIWYGGPRRRIRVDFDNRLRQATLAAVEEARQVLTVGTCVLWIDHDVKQARRLQLALGARMNGLVGHVRHLDGDQGR